MTFMVLSNVHKAYLASMAIINGRDVLKTVKEGFFPVIKVRLDLSVIPQV
jgi:hypothetical protein